MERRSSSKKRRIFQLTVFLAGIPWQKNLSHATFNQHRISGWRRTLLPINPLLPTNYFNYSAFLQTSLSIKVYRRTNIGDKSIVSSETAGVNLPAATRELESLSRRPGIVELAASVSSSLRSRSRGGYRYSSEPVVTVPTRDVVNAARERIHLRVEGVTASRRS